jgi:hypothetical protein
MRLSSERRLGRGGALACAVLLACGGDDSAPGELAAGSDAMPAPVSAAASAAAPPAARASAAAQVAPAALGGRTRELVNPDPDTVVLAYFDLAGLTPPFDSWVEKDSRISLAQPIDKQAQRDVVRAELAAAAEAARGVGSLRFTMSANLSDYDPVYEEFTVRALAPSSVVTFDGFGQRVELRFANGLAAQVWRVPKADAQLIRDQLGYARAASVDVLARIVDVQPGVNGGTITTHVVEYELRADPSGATLARVQLATP